MKPEVYSCLKMLEAFKESCDESYGAFLADETHSASGICEQYGQIAMTLALYLSSEQMRFIPHVKYRSDELAVLLELSSAAGVAIAYLRSLDSSLEKELREKQVELERKERELESMRKILKESLDAVKEFPEVQRSAAVATWKRQHRDIEEASRHPDAGRERAEDLKDTYLPWRLVLLKIIEGVGSLDFGGLVWSDSDSNERFEDLSRSGLLKLERHAVLEREAIKLTQLRRAHNDAYAPYEDAVRKASQAAFDAASVSSPEVGGPLTVSDVVGQAPDSRLWVAVAMSDKAGWVARVEELVRQKGPDNAKVSSDLGVLYDEVIAKVAPAKLHLRETGEALVSHARAMLVHLDDAIRTGSAY